MNTFMDNPLLFFMDNMSPIFCDTSSKDARKIIEITDTGCDARPSPILPPQNVNHYYPTKSSKMRSNDNWRPPDEEQISNTLKKEKSWGRNQWSAKDGGELHFIPKHDQNNYQHNWQKEFPREDDHHPKDAMFQKKSHSTDVPIDTKAPEKSRTRRWNREELYKYPENYQNPSSVMKNDQHVRNKKESKSKDTEHLQYTGYSNYAKFNAKLYEQDSTVGSHGMGPVEDYPEDFESEQALRNPRRNRRNLWQQRTVYRGHDNSVDEILLKNQRLSGIDSKKAKAPSSAKSIDSSKSPNETRSSRNRSRTCSPPPDRRKRTRSFAKTGHENVEQPDSNAASVQHENPASSSPDKEKRLVDRGVDRDSLPDVLNISTFIENSSNTMPNCSEMDENSDMMKSSFWEFIPFDNEGNEKCRKAPERVRLGSYSYPLAKGSANPEDSSINSKTKKLMGEKNCADTTIMKSVDDSSPLLTNNKRNFSSAVPRVIQLTKAFMDSGEAKWRSKIEENAEAMEKLDGQDRNKHESKDQSRFDSKHHSEWTEKANKYLKRPGSAPKAETDSDKKKKMTENPITNVSGDKKLESNFILKTTACLKRKLERSKTDEVAMDRCTLTTTDKKIRPERSRLPIRIGTRFRSKNPVAHCLQNYTKPNAERNENSVESVENSNRLSSVRSRTKPKSKPSVELKKVVLDSVKSLGNQMGMGKVSVARNIEDYVGNRQVQGSNVIGNNADRKLIESLDKRFLSRTKLVGDKERDINFSKDETVDFNMEKLEDDGQRKFSNRNYGKEMSQRNGLVKDLNPHIPKNGYKEKCVFHIKDEENLVCSSFCKSKVQKNSNVLQAKKITNVKSRL